jgi:hypothetical protein
VFNSADKPPLPPKPKKVRVDISDGDDSDVEVVESPCKSRKLFDDSPKANSSFLKQFGATSGTELLTPSAIRPASHVLSGNVGTSNQNFTIVTQAATVAHFKQLEGYSSNEWYTFIKHFREETQRQPAISRRPLKELIMPTVVEQLREEFDFAHWDSVTEADVLTMFFSRFGPKSARDAKKRLCNHKYHDTTIFQYSYYFIIMTPNIMMISRPLDEVDNTRHQGLPSHQGHHRCCSANQRDKRTGKH